MSGNSWFGKPGSGGRGRTRARAGLRLRPAVGELEDRRLPSTFTVTSPADTAPAGDPAPGTLRWAVEQADAAGSDSAIDLDLDATQAVIVLVDGPLELSNTKYSIQIDAPATGVTISGGGIGGVFQIEPGVSASLSGLTITGGASRESGGGLYNGGALTLVGCTISGNSAQQDGGGLYNAAGATAYLTGCTISGNSAVSDGGGVYNQGTLTATGCTIGGNSGYFGGGLKNHGTATLDSCTISGNSAMDGGGGVYARGATSLTGCTISGNSGYFGGGLENLQSATLEDCTIYGNSGYLGGGALNYGAATLTACTISGNSAKTGGGLYNYGTRSYRSNATLTDTIVANNSDSDGPGEIGGVQAQDVVGSNDLIGPGGSGGIAAYEGGNIVLSSSESPGLAPLGDYGGPTETVALLPGSVAIGAGAAVDGLDTDQRGLALDPLAPDIGAFQSQGFTFEPVDGSTPQTALPSSAFADPLAVTVIANNPEEPVAGGVVTFTVDSDQATGASATLSATTAIIGADGVAAVTATADSSLGSFTVAASAQGAPIPCELNLSNQVELNFSGLSDTSITYGSAVTFSGTLSDGSQGPEGQAITVTVGSMWQVVPIGVGGAFSATFDDTTTLDVSGSPYTVTFAYSGNEGYSSVTATSTLTVDPATPSLQVSDPGGIYDGTAFPAIAAFIGPSDIGLGNTAIVISYYAGSTASGAPLDAAPTHAGTYTALAGFAGSADYTAASASCTFSIAPAPLTITAEDESMPYGGPLPALAATYAGFVPGDSPAVLTALPTLGTTATPSSGVADSPYPITASGAADPDYAITYVAGALTVTAATPTVVVTDGGGTYDGDPFAASATVAGVNDSAGSTLENAGVSVTYYAGSTASGAPLDAAPTHAGTYTALAGFAGSADYTAASASCTFSIAPAPLTITAEDESMPYGGPLPALTATYTGFVPGDSPAVLTALPTLGTTATSSSGVADSPYPITASGAADPDYAITYVAGALTVAAATPEVNVTDAGGTYDGEPFAASAAVAGVDGTFGASVEGTGLALLYYAGSTASGVPLDAAPTHAGTYTAMARFPGSADYTAASATCTFIISPAPLTITANDQTMPYGGPLPALAATYAGFVPGDSPAVLTALPTLGTTATSSSGVADSPYPITASGAADPDYAITYVAGALTVAAATPEVNVTDAGGTYDGEPFAASATVTGVGRSTGATLEGIAPSLTYYAGSTATGTPLAGAPSVVGTYTVVAAFPGSADYTAAQSSPVTFAIARPALQLTWSTPASIVYGTALTSAQLDATANIPGTFTYKPAAGTILDAGADQVLSVTFTPDDTADYTPATATTTITVTPATPSLDISAPGGTYDGSPFPATVTVAGTVGTAAAPAASLQDVSPVLSYYAGSSVSGAGLGSTPPAAPGTYTVVASYPGSADYAATRTEPVTFTITQGTAAVALISSGGSAVYGQAVTLSVRVSGPSTPTGTVTFLDDGMALGTVAIDGAGQATLTTTALPVGVQSITAEYSGDADFLGVTSPSISESVAPSATRLVLTTHPVFKRKKLVTAGLKAMVTPLTPGSGEPTGTVTFEVKQKKKVVVLGTAALSGGDATLTLKAQKILKKAVTIIYSGDADFGSSAATSPTLTQAAIKGLS